jgi:hypothetical protein
MATSTLNVNSLAFLNASAQSLATATATADTLTFSSNGGSGVQLKGLATPSASSDAAPKSYVDGLVNGIKWKTSCKAASAANFACSQSGSVLTASATGVMVIDGVNTWAVGDRVLLQSQTSSDENGIYAVTTAGAVGVAAVLTRADDANTSAELIGSAIFCEQGTANADNGFVCTSDTITTLNSSAVAFSVFSTPGGLNYGDGIQLASGNTISVGVDGATIELNSDAVRIKAGGVGSSHIATDAVTAAAIAANAVGASELANDAVDTAAVADDAITAAKIASNAVGASELADNAVDTAAVANDAITAAKIAANAVTASELANDAVDTAAVADDAITAAKIAANAVGASELADDAVDTAAVANSAITSACLANSLAISGTFSAQSLQATSDRRLKENITEISPSECADKVAMMQAYRYQFINAPGRRRCGFMAQDAEHWLSECVEENPEGMKSISYLDIVAVLAGAIKQLQQEVRELRNA